MNLALITAGIQTVPAKPVGRPVTGRASARYQAEDEQGDQALTHEQIEAEIVRILKLGDPKTPGDLAREIGVHWSAIPYRIEALRLRHRELQYRVESNFAIAWWRQAC